MIQLSANDDGLILTAFKKGGSAIIVRERLSGAEGIGIYVVYSEDAAAGDVVIECAPLLGHRGEWAKLDTVSWVKGGRCHYVGTDGPHLFIRVRLLDDVIGGTVSVYAVGN